VHRVAAGETLGGIARRSGTTVADLAVRNGIRDPNRLREGMVLRLGPAAAPTWICPVQGVVRLVSGFGDPRAGGHKHQGVDIAAPRGRPVVANVSGVLTHHPNPLGGLAYYLQGDDGDTYYGAHLDSYVGPDRRVRLGEAIGRVGDTGDARGGITHLHFERLPKGGAAVDPAPRLLPVCPTG
jgi:murein DD-endopeptidase MepM/ murein hydrolase activator NlpD